MPFPVIVIFRITHTQTHLIVTSVYIVTLIKKRKIKFYKDWK